MVKIAGGKTAGRRIEKAVVISPYNRRPNQIGMISPTVSQGFMIVATLLELMGLKVLAIDEQISPIAQDEYLQRVIREADLIAMGAMTAHENAGYKWLEWAQKYNSDCITIAGGMGPTAQPEKGLRNGADFVLQYEVEETVKMLINLLRNGGEYKEVPGLCWLEGDQFFRNKRSNPPEDLDSLVPLINWNLLYKKEKAIAVVGAATRGCPFDCNFCTVSANVGRKVRMMSPERALEHAKNAAWPRKKSLWLSFKPNGLYFHGDDNIAISQRWAQDYFTLLAESGLGKNMVFSSEMRAKDHTRDLLRIMREAGNTASWFGLESINDGTLKNMGKKQTVADILTAFRNAREEKIALRAMCIFGNDADEVGFGEEIARFVKENEAGLLIPYIRSPLYGTRDTMSLENSGRLLNVPDTYRCDGGHVAFRPKNMTPAQLQLEHLKAIKAFFNWRRIFDKKYQGLNSAGYKAYWAWASRQIPALEKHVSWYIEKYLL